MDTPKMPLERLSPTNCGSQNPQSNQAVPQPLTPSVTPAFMWGQGVIPSSIARGDTKHLWLVLSVPSPALAGVSAHMGVGRGTGSPNLQPPCARCEQQLLRGQAKRNTSDCSQRTCPAAPSTASEPWLLCPVPSWHTPFTPGFTPTAILVEPKAEKLTQEIEGRFDFGA